MGAGTFGGLNGKRPFHLSAFSKIKLGWLNPTVVNLEQYSIALPAVETNAQVLKLTPTENSSEYFLVENRQELGFDDGLKQRNLCPGILIWHIDENNYTQYLRSNRVNTSINMSGPTHPSVAIVEQDGDNALLTAPYSLGSCTDTYIPNTSWRDNTPGNSRLWNGTTSNLSLSVGSKNSDGSINIDVNPATPNATPSPTPTPQVIYGKIKLQFSNKTIIGRLISNDATDNLTATLTNNKTKKVVSNATVSKKGRFTFRKIKKGSYTISIINLSKKVIIK